MADPGSVPAAEFDPRVGLCSVCRWSRTVVSGHGSTFWLCQRAAVDARFRKYPPLPVRSCPGFEGTALP